MTAQREFILILNNNYFRFEGDYYLRTKGTAMGTRFAPSYANLFMGYWEKHHIHPSTNTTMGLVTWKRYIDDCLFIWQGSNEELATFLDTLNTNKFNIKLTSNVSKSSVNFLDLVISVDSNNLLTSLYQKPTDTNGFILKK